MKSSFQGVKIKMDDGGNIMVKRVSRSNVYVKEVKTEENSISNDVIIAGGLLEMEKPVKVLFYWILNVPYRFCLKAWDNEAFCT